MFQPVSYIFLNGVLMGTSKMSEDFPSLLVFPHCRKPTSNPSLLGSVVFMLRVLGNRGTSGNESFCKVKLGEELG